MGRLPTALPPSAAVAGNQTRAGLTSEPVRRAVPVRSFVFIVPTDPFARRHASGDLGGIQADGQQATTWMSSANAHLDGARPIDVLALGGPGPALEALDAGARGGAA